MPEFAEIKIDAAELEDLRRVRGELDATTDRIDNQEAKLRSAADEISSKLTTVLSRANRVAHMLERMLSSQAFRELAGITKEQQAELLDEIGPVTRGLRAGVRGAIIGRTLFGPYGAIGGAGAGAIAGALADPSKARQAAGWVDALRGKLADDLNRLEIERQALRRARRRTGGE